MSNPECNIEPVDIDSGLKSFSTSIDAEAAKKLSRLVMTRLTKAPCREHAGQILRVASENSERSFSARLDKETAQKFSRLVMARLICSARASTREQGPPFIPGISSEVNKDLRWIYDQDNPPLYQFLEEHIHCESWQKILRLRDLKLLEQIKLFYDLLLVKGYTEPYPTDSVVWAFENTPQTEALTVFAQLTYYLDRHPECALDVNLKSAFEFKNKLASLNNEIELFIQDYQIHSAQLTDEALSVELPNLIAKTLLISNGEINFGLIPLIQKNFSELSESYISTLMKRLDNLYSDSELRSILPKIKAPDSSITRSTTLLQILNELPPNAVVTDQHAQHAVLAAFLSHIRQISPNGCFSIVVCQSELESNPKQCLEDFQNLISKGSLTRELNHVKREYPFLLTVSPKNIDCEYPHTHHALADSPLLRSACLSIGIPQYRERIMHVKLPKTGQEIIKEISDHDEDLILRGNLAVEFQTRNGLLTMWHNCIAGMSEGKISSLITSEILEAVVRSIDADYQGLDQHHMQLKEKLQQGVVEELLGRMFLLYDPALRHETLGNGGFVLYDHNHTRIDNPKAFQELICDILDTVSENVSSDKESEESNLLFRKMIAGLKECIYTDQFLDRLLERYMGQKIKGASKNLDDVAHTPWITRTGNSTEATLSVYLNKNNSLKSKSFKTVSAENLLDQLKRFYQVRRLARHTVPNFMPARVSGLHAFNMIPLPEDFSGLDVPKEKIRIDIHYQKKMVSIIKNQGSLDELDIQISEKISLNTFREHLLDLWNKASPIGKDDPLNRERLLDTLLIGNLPLKKKIKVMSQSIPIADSNWSVNSHDIYFYCVYNPLSKKIELWKMGTDYSEPTALNPDVWVNEKTWEVFYL